MAFKKISRADRRMIESVIDHDELAKRVAYHNTEMNAIQKIRKHIADDPSSIGRYTKKSGHSEGRIMQRIGSVPLYIVAAINNIDPYFWEDPRKTDWLLEQFPEFKTTELVK